MLPHNRGIRSANNALTTSAPPRWPDRTAPSMYPRHSREVSVPTKCTRPTGVASSLPTFVRTPGVVIGQGAPRKKASLVQSISSVLVGAGTSTNSPKLRLNCSQACWRRTARGSFDQFLPLSPTRKQVIDHWSSTGILVSRVKIIGPLSESRTPESPAVCHQGSLNT
jgi:hypothetical protein